MEETGWTDRVRKKGILHRVKEDINMVPAIYRRKANWIGHILRRNCLLKHVIEGKKEGMIKVARRRGRKRNQILNDHEEHIGYCKLKLEAPDCTL
jgi:two-component sensor histidine kinase